MQTPRIPLNLFGMGFGLSGLAECWVTVARVLPAPSWPGDALLALAAVVWAGTLAVYLRGVVRAPSTFAADLTNSITAPFASLAVITPLLLASLGIAPHALLAGRICVDILLVLTVLLGAWMTGQWIYRPVDIDKFHPGYFLPTAAGGLIASSAATAVGQFRLGEAMLGFGIVCWLILGSMIMARIFFRPPLPAALLPTVAIEVAPPAVASLAWFGLNGGRIDLFAAALAGYGVLMVLTQMRLLPAYLRLSFGPGLWVFTFSWAAAAAATTEWIVIGRPAGYRVYVWIVLAAITLFIGGIAVRTAIAIARRDYIPPAPAPAPVGQST